jgi:Na+/phosphate symporter
MRLLQKKEQDISYKYAETIRRLQTIADCQRDIIMRSKTHVDNQHKGLIKEQIEDLTLVQRLLNDILLAVESTFNKRQAADYAAVFEKDKKLQELADSLNEKQIYRIVSDESKTRLSILFYAILENSLRLSKHSLRLLRLFEESFGKLEMEARTLSPTKS